MPGVVAVLTLDDLAPVLRQRRMMRHFEFRHAARPELAVRARRRRGVLTSASRSPSWSPSDRYIAEDAAALVAVDYDVLPAATDCRVASDAPPVRRELDVEPGHRLQGRLRRRRRGIRQGRACRARGPLAVHRGAAHSIEGRGILAESPTATTHSVGLDAEGARSAATRWPTASISTKAGCASSRPTSAAASAQSSASIPRTSPWSRPRRLLRRSVKWIEDRREHFTNAVQERDQYWSIEIAVDADGKVLRRARQAAPRHRRLRAAGRQHPVQFARPR